MATEWIKASLALQFVADGNYDYLSKLKICERAHSGLIKSKAATIVWGGNEENNKEIPKGFWWAGGEDALRQDWEAGDFSTWVEEKIEVKAFDVSFDFMAISELVPADRQADALRKISVVGNDTWMSASSLLSLMHQKTPNSTAGLLLQEACRLGQVGGRAMRVTCSRVERSHVYPLWTTIEWDIPLWFWRDFADPKKCRLDWSSGKMKTEGRRKGQNLRFELQGIHFHDSGLLNLGLGSLSKTLSPARAGRKPVHDWQAANSAIWGQIFRGELIPENQAMIERALIIELTRGDKEPSESTVRPYAKQIWTEFQKA